VSSKPASVNTLSDFIYLKRGSDCISLDRGLISLGMAGPAAALEAAMLVAKGVETSSWFVVRGDCLRPAEGAGAAAVGVAIGEAASDDAAGPHGEAAGTAAARGDTADTASGVATMGETASGEAAGGALVPTGETAGTTAARCDAASGVAAMNGEAPDKRPAADGEPTGGTGSTA